MEVRYKCSCMVNEGSFFVRDRRPDENVVEWMKGAVTPALTETHRLISPKCTKTTIEYVKLPMPPGAAMIGGPIVN